MDIIKELEQDEIKRLVTGAVIVAAVIGDYYRHRLGKARTL